jgi:hypothetical protein
MKQRLARGPTIHTERPICNLALNPDKNSIVHAVAILALPVAPRQTTVGHPPVSPGVNCQAFLCCPPGGSKRDFIHLHDLHDPSLLPFAFVVEMCGFPGAIAVATQFCVMYKTVDVGLNM